MTILPISKYSYFFVLFFYLCSIFFKIFPRCYIPIFDGLVFMIVAIFVLSRFTHFFRQFLLAKIAITATFSAFRMYAPATYLAKLTFSYFCWFLGVQSIVIHACILFAFNLNSIQNSRGWSGARDSYEKCWQRQTKSARLQSFSFCPQTFSLLSASTICKKNNKKMKLWLYR